MSVSYTHLDVYKRQGWVCVCGNILNDDHRCPSCNKKYILSDGEMKGLEE